MAKYNLDEIISNSNKNKKKKYDLDEIMNKYNTPQQEIAPITTNTQNTVDIAPVKETVNDDIIQELQNALQNKDLTEEKRQIFQKSLEYYQNNPSAIIKSQNKLDNIAQRAEAENMEFIPVNLEEEMAKKKALERAEERNKQLENAGNLAPLLYPLYMIEGFGEGIRSGTGKLGNAVMNITGTILDKASNVTDFADDHIPLGNTTENLKNAKNKVLDESKSLNLRATEYSKSLQYTDDKVVKTGGTVSNVIGEMAPGFMATIASGGSAAPAWLSNAVQAVQVYGGASTEALNADNTNIDKANLSGGLKGLAAYTTNKIVGGNFISSGATDRLAIKGIEKITGNKVAQNILWKIYQIKGEQVEELLEDDIDALIDYAIDGKELPKFDEWIKQRNETKKITGISTLVLNILGLGGGNIDTAKLQIQQQDIENLQKQVEKLEKQKQKTTSKEELQDIENNINWKNKQINALSKVLSINIEEMQQQNEQKSTSEVKQDKNTQIETLNKDIETLQKQLPKTTNPTEVQEIQNELAWKNKQLQALATNQNEDIAPIKETIKTETQDYKSKLTEEINNSNLSQEDKTQFLDFIKDENITQETYNDLKNNLSEVEKATAEANKLNTDEKYNTGRKEKYIQYMNDNSDYDTTDFDSIMEFVRPNNQGRRTKEQWLSIADELGKRISNKSNEEIEKIAYKTWQDTRPNAKENLNRQGQGFVQFNSDEWIDTIYNAANQARENNQVKQEIAPIKETNTEQINQDKVKSTEDKVSDYINKTGLKMSAQEFIKKAQSLTLENETNMTAEQKELYNIIKEVQDSNKVKEDVIDYDNGIWYNDKGIDYSNKFYEHELDSAITTDTPNLEYNKLYTKEFGENFYMFEKTADGEYTKYLQIRIKGNEEFISQIEKEFNDGINAKPESISEMLTKMWVRQANDNGINDSIKKQSRQDESSSRLSNRTGEEQFNKFRQSGKTDNENSNVKRVQGLENYDIKELKSSLKTDIRQILDDNELSNIDIIDIELHGSRLRGTAKTNSDLDVVVQYKGDIREDTLFDILNENPIEIEGIKVDINPIQEDIKDYMVRSDKYDQEILSRNNSNTVNEEYEQLTIEGFNNEPENNLSKENWTKYQESKQETNKELQKNGTKVEVEKRKFSKDFIDNGYIDLNGKTVENAADVADIAQIFRNPKYETFRVIYMQGNTIVGQEAVSSKLPSETRPFTKNDSTAKGLYKIQNRMERLGADGYYLIHNHPTGIAKASNADIDLTKVMDKRVKGFLGHVIINSGTYALIEHPDIPSFKNTLVWKDDIKIDNYKPDAIDKMMNTDGWTNMKLKDRTELINFAYDLKNNPNYSSLIMLDTKLKPRIVLDLPNNFLNMSAEQVDGYIRNVAKQNGANVALIATQDMKAFNNANNLKTIADSIIYTIDDKGTLKVKDYMPSEMVGNKIFKNYNGIAMRANEKISDIYNDLFNVTEQQQENLAPTKKTLNPTEISQIAPIKASTTPELGTKKMATGNKVSSFLSNVTETTKSISQEARDFLRQDDNVKYYKGISNEQSLGEAYDRLQKGGAEETLRWFNQDITKTNASDIAEGWILLKQYQDAGDYNSMVEVAKKMRSLGTNVGQAVQAFNIMARLTPEGMVKFAQTELSEAYDNMIKNKTKDWIDSNKGRFELTADETEYIVETMNKISQMEDGYNKKVELGKIQQMLNDKLPPEAGSQIKSWMRISMLFNPKTQVRNVAGNTLIVPINDVADVFASLADKAISKYTGKRTTGTTNVAAKLEGFKRGAYEATNDYRLGINTKEIDGNRFEVGKGKSFNDKHLIGKALNRTESMLNYVMDVGDRVFSEAAFENSIQNQLKLNHTTEITQDMIDIATTEALQRTWNDNNNYTRFVLNTRANLNKLNIKGYGLGDILIPFAKTPANLTKAIVDYSPVGLVNTLTKGIELKRSLSNGQYSAKLQHQFVQNLGKATAGTLLYVLGGALAKAGIISGKNDDDKDTANFLKNTLGINSYSIKIGDKSFTYDWAQPIAAPFSIMANVVNSKDKGIALLEGITGSLDTAGSILLEQSFLQSINDVLTDNDGVVSGIINEILELPARAIPTFSKQVADMVDGTQRQTFVYDNPLQSAKNNLITKIPFASKTLAPSIDTMGREIQKYGGKNNIFNVFLNPANVSTENISTAAEEIYEVYKAVGDKTIMPRVAPYYVDTNNGRINLTPEQRAEYQKVAGDIIEKSIDNMLKNPKYVNAKDTDKSEILNNIVNYSYNVAKKEVLNLDISNTYEKAYEYSKIGNVEDFYLFKNIVVETNAATKRQSMLNYFTSSKLTQQQKAFLYKRYFDSDDIDTMINSKIDIEDYIRYLMQDIKADKDSKGNSISGSKKNKVLEYVNSLNLTIPQKAILIKATNDFKFNDYNNEIVNYVSNLSLSYSDKVSLLKELGMTVDSNGNVKW